MTLPYTVNSYPLSNTWLDGRFDGGDFTDVAEWKDGIFKSGIIYDGIFMKGKIESGEKRGGKFVDCEISPRVTEYVEGEKAQEVLDAEPIIEPVEVQNDLRVVIKENKKNTMRQIKDFKRFINESTGDIENQYVGNGYDNVDVKQTDGGIEMSSNSKTDIYNLKQTHGGEVIEKDGLYILYIKDKK
jgi:hypothetical protein